MRDGAAIGRDQTARRSSVTPSCSASVSPDCGRCAGPFARQRSTRWASLRGTTIPTEASAGAGSVTWRARTSVAVPAAAAMPKSATSARPLADSSRMLSGFTSRCTSPCRCAQPSAHAASRRTRARELECDEERVERGPAHGMGRWWRNSAEQGRCPPMSCVTPGARVRGATHAQAPKAREGRLSCRFDGRTRQC
jgi:hypothetical protein